MTIKYLPQYTVLSPAYGRDFKTAKEAIANWESGQDWVIESLGPDMGRYASCENQAANATVELRYRDLRQAVMHKADAKALARMHNNKFQIGA